MAPRLAAHRNAVMMHAGLFARIDALHAQRDRLGLDTEDLALLDRDIRRHCEETTIIMRAFARDWLGHNAYHRGKDISRADAAGFAHVAPGRVRHACGRRSCEARQQWGRRVRAAAQ